MTRFLSFLIVTACALGACKSSTSNPVIAEPAEAPTETKSEVTEVPAMLRSQREDVVDGLDQLAEQLRKL